MLGDDDVGDVVAQWLLSDVRVCRSCLGRLCDSFRLRLRIALSAPLAISWIIVAGLALLAIQDYLLSTQYMLGLLRDLDALTHAVQITAIGLPLFTLSVSIGSGVGVSLISSTDSSLGDQVEGNLLALGSLLISMLGLMIAARSLLSPKRTTPSDRQFLADVGDRAPRENHSCSGSGRRSGTGCCGGRRSSPRRRRPRA